MTRFRHFGLICAVDDGAAERSYDVDPHTSVALATGQNDLISRKIGSTPCFPWMIDTYPNKKTGVGYCSTGWGTAEKMLRMLRMLRAERNLLARGFSSVSESIRVFVAYAPSPINARNGANHTLSIDCLRYVVRHPRQHAHLVREFAAACGILLRAAQGHRARSSDEWKSWIAERAARAALPSVPTSLDRTPGAGGDAPDGPLGITAEIQRMRIECRDQAAEVQATPDEVSRWSKIRVLNESRARLREFERDYCDIMEQAGSVVPIPVVARYLTEIRTLWESLPKRISTLLPEDIRADIRARIEAECATICAVCQELKLEDTPS